MKGRGRRNSRKRSKNTEIVSGGEKKGVRMEERERKRWMREWKGWGRRR